MLTTTASPITDRVQRGGTGAATIAVWTGWALMTVIALAFVFVYGRNVPSWDDWDIVPTVTGAQPVTWNWLWSQHNEHRIPVPRLVMLAIFRGFMDFRAGMVANVVLSAGMTAWLLRVVRQVRGRREWTDLFLPLVALNLGQGLNFMWAWQIGFFVSTALMLALLVIVARHSAIRPGGRIVVAIGVLVFLLAGSGANGLVPVPVMIVWAIGVAWLSRGTVAAAGARSRWAGATIVVLCGVVAMGTYLHGYERVPHFPTGHGLSGMVVTGIKAMTMSFGAAGRAAWPFSGALVLAIVGLTLAKLVGMFLNDPENRLRSWGLFCFIGAVVGLAAALGLGRNGFEERYATLLYPLLSGVYFVWSLDDGGRASRWMRTVLTGVALIALWPNTSTGLAYAKDLSGALTTFEQQMTAGVPLTQLIARHSRRLHPSHDLLMDYLPLLRAAKVGAFARLRDDPETERVSLSPEQWTMSGATREGRTIRHEGRAWITVKLPRQMKVAGVSLIYGYENARRQQPFVMLEWRRNAQNWGEPDRSYYWSPTGDRGNWQRGSFLRLTDGDPRLHCWIWDDVTEIRIFPDYIPGKFELKELTLITPKGD